MKTRVFDPDIHTFCALGGGRAVRHESPAARHIGVTSQGGFSLITTLFLLVVVASLGAYMVNLATAQHTSGALSAQKSRAFYAAVSGLEWVAQEIRNNPGACPVVPSSFTAEGFTISLSSCSRVPVTESGTSYALYDVTVDVSRGAFGSSNYVSRSLRATMGE